MDEQTQTPSQPESSQPEPPTADQVENAGPDPGSAPSSSGSSSEESTDWQNIAQMIATELEKKQPTYQTIQANVFGQEVELRIVHQATVGELLVSSLLLLTISTFCLRWLFKAVWGR